MKTITRVATTRVMTKLMEELNDPFGNYSRRCLLRVGRRDSSRSYGIKIDQQPAECHNVRIGRGRSRSPKITVGRSGQQCRVDLLKSPVHSFVVTAVCNLDGVGG